MFLTSKTVHPKSRELLDSIYQIQNSNLASNDLNTAHNEFLAIFSGPCNTNLEMLTNP